LDRSITCWADGKVIDWHKAGVSPITITDETLIAEPSPENILRPHEIGLIPASSGNMIQHRAEEIFKKEKRSNLKTHQEKLNDKECWLVSYTIERPGKPVEVRYWIAPALGNAVMRVEVRFEADERAFVDSIESDHKEVQPGVWFPEKCLYQRRVNDKIATQEILHIKVNKYNADPEPTAFTLQGMNIPPGAPLSIVSKTDKRAGFALTWDGKEIVFSK
jgi:hypothetical protein